MRSTFVITALLLFPVGSSAQVPCTTDARQVVNAAYLQVLERPVNRQVTDPLVAQLMQGATSVREIVRELVMSPEHRQRFLTANTPAARDAAVTALYRHILGRTPDEGGLRSHADALVKGDPTVVINSLLDSPEYQQAFGDDAVPGGRARYCGAAASINSGVNRMRFGTMDRNGNGTIDRSEWTGSREAFTARDWNSDGVLSGDEVRNGARRSPRVVDEMEFDPTGGPAAWTTEQFRLLDRNRDNRVTSSEWYYAPEFFLRADRNRDGILTATEFTGSNAANASSPWDDDRDVRFADLDMNGNGATLDANRNGTLSISEWRWSRGSFTRYDTDQDGLISRQEFVQGGGSPTDSTSVRWPGRQ